MQRRPTRAANENCISFVGIRHENCQQVSVMQMGELCVSASLPQQCVHWSPDMQIPWPREKQMDIPNVRFGSIRYGNLDVIGD